MMNEAVDAAMDNNDLEEETDEEIAKVLDEVLAGKVGQLPSVAVGGTNAREPAVAAAAAGQEEDSEEDEMERRLQALRS